MSTLTYSDETWRRPKPEAVAPRRSFWHRVYDGMVESQQRRAEREIARYLASHGGLSDRRHGARDDAAPHRQGQAAALTNTSEPAGRSSRPADA